MRVSKRWLSVLPHYDSEKRKERRYTLHMPVRVTVPADRNAVFDALSDNISAHGILLQTNHPLDQGIAVRLLVKVPPTPAHSHLTGVGTVVRASKASFDSYVLAVCCHKRPFLLKKFRGAE